MTNFEPFNETGSTNTQPKRITVYRFDLFKGVLMEDGKVAKVKSVGSAFVREGLQTYTVHLKALLKDTFYLLPNTRPNTPGDYVILTRELSQKAGKKYFWNNVGIGQCMDGLNDGVMRLTWDVLLADDIYMTVEPISASDVADVPPSILQAVA